MGSGVKGSRAHAWQPIMSIMSARSPLRSGTVDPFHLGTDLAADWRKQFRYGGWPAQGPGLDRGGRKAAPVCASLLRPTQRPRRPGSSAPCLRPPAPAALPAAPTSAFAPASSGWTPPPSASASRCSATCWAPGCRPTSPPSARCGHPPAASNIAAGRASRRGVPPCWPSQGRMCVWCGVGRRGATQSRSAAPLRRDRQPSDDPAWCASRVVPCRCSRARWCDAWTTAWACCWSCLRGRAARRSPLATRTSPTWQMTRWRRSARWAGRGGPKPGLWVGVHTSARRSPRRQAGGSCQSRLPAWQTACAGAGKAGACRVTQRTLCPTVHSHNHHQYKNTHHITFYTHTPVPCSATDWASGCARECLASARWTGWRRCRSSPQSLTKTS